MPQLQDFNINELMLFIIGVLGSLGGLCLIIQKSKCEEISFCCFKCKRDVRAIIEEERLEKTGHAGNTPRLPESASDAPRLDNP